MCHFDGLCYLYSTMHDTENSDARTRMVVCNNSASYYVCFSVIHAQDETPPRGLLSCLATCIGLCRTVLILCHVCVDRTSETKIDELTVEARRTTPGETLRIDRFRCDSISLCLCFISFLSNLCIFVFCY